MLLALACVTTTLAPLPATPQGADAAPVDFTRQVRPILSGHCFACHGPDAESREADLDLSERASALDVIEPGDRAASELWARIRDADDPMPPEKAHDPLSAEQIETLGRWIDEGASYAPHWAYVAPVRVAPPAGEGSVVDRFLRARWHAEGIAPAPMATAEKQLRRVWFDLAGLPPPVEVLDRFGDAQHATLDDASYERIVEELLADVHFAERFATVWLDLVRYADTVGYHGDQTHHVWPYRDWVIRALDQNVPFDRFTIAQLAGDLLPEPTRDDLIASTYNRLIQTSHEGGVQLEEYRAIYMGDRVRNVSEVWLGGTLGCAECHDHKYDPYTARDFYAMGAFFADVDEEEHLRNPYNGLNKLPTPRVPELALATDAQQHELDEARRRMDAAQRALDEYKRSTAPDAQRVAELEKAWNRSRSDVRRLDAAIPRTLYTKALAEPREVRVLPRGNWLDKTGEVVQPAVPAFLGAVATETGTRPSRLDLARWLVTPAAEGGVGELTARVFCNRVWAELFGVGLCPSVEDFGGQGRPPTHLELLDTLALDFVASGWDVKALVRRLVRTDAYRRSAHAPAASRAHDPENLLCARQGRTRLSAEMVRDAALAVSGLLVDEFGGPPVHPPQPAGYYSHLNFPQRRYRADRDQRQWRRGVYVHWQRQFLHPMLAAFDAPARTACAARRNVSTTPTQSLALLNDPVFVEAARALAGRVLNERRGDDRERVAFAFRSVTSRRPSPAELDVLLALLERSRQSFANDPSAAASLVAVGDAPRGSELPDPELAAWTQVARALLNLHEAISRD